MNLDIEPFTYEDWINFKEGQIILCTGSCYSKSVLESKIDNNQTPSIIIMKRLNPEQLCEIATIRCKTRFNGLDYEYYRQMSDKFNLLSKTQWPSYYLDDKETYLYRSEDGSYVWKLSDLNASEFLDVKLTHPDIIIEQPDAKLIDYSLSYIIQRDIYMKFFKNNPGLFDDLTSKNIAKIRTRVRGVIKK